ncbi:MAG: 3-isopropylmalate dehydratase small subunit [Bacteroidetes bacterium]|nr:MAG: 3-isopropylmalate dehydratase small subunit [Bacteroidota bacterium]
MSKAINHITSTAVPLPIENIDTDQIIPARFLKSTTRTGFGQNLFRDWRYNNDDVDSPKAEFVLNDTKFGGKILIAGKNFGCGSSREHAAWALKDYGFDVVVSSFFADIFRNNALNNFLVPVQVTDAFLQQLIAYVLQHPQAQLEVNVQDQQIALPQAHLQEHFELNAYKKTCLLNGFDDIDYLLSIGDDIKNYELQRR